jgi:hypothetical protein
MYIKGNGTKLILTSRQGRENQARVASIAFFGFTMDVESGERLRQRGTACSTGWVDVSLFEREVVHVDI